MAENPMLLRMLASMTGVTPEQLQETITGIGTNVRLIAETQVRIEKNTLILLKAENDRREHEGRDPVNGYLDG